MNTPNLARDSVLEAFDQLPNSEILSDYLYSVFVVLIISRNFLDLHACTFWGHRPDWASLCNTFLSSLIVGVTYC